MGFGQLKVALGRAVDRLDPRVGELQRAALAIVGHRLGGIAVAQRLPRGALGRIGGAMHLAQLGARHKFLQAREHPAGADRRQLAGVPDEHERAPRSSIVAVRRARRWVSPMPASSR
jgi:predicted alpha/beta hydrolase family esterase